MKYNYNVKKGLKGRVLRVLNKNRCPPPKGSSL